MSSKYLRDLPLQAKLRAIILIVSGTALLGAFAVFLTYQWVSSRNSLADQLRVTAEIVGDQSTAALEFGQKEQARAILAALRAEMQIVAAAVYDKEDRLFAQYLREGADPRRLALRCDRR